MLGFFSVELGSTAGITHYPQNRGVVSTNAGGALLSRQSLPTDPAGIVTLRFSGIKAGSELHIFYPDGSKGASIESSVDNQQVTVQRYAARSPFNNVRVLIASLGYENLDFSIELPEENSSVSIFQRIDRAYRNPA